jgi:hypothetical protein
MNCSYFNFADVIRAVQKDGMNVTSYVASCDRSCTVIFGAGNPVEYTQ